MIEPQPLYRVFSPTASKNQASYTLHRDKTFAHALAEEHNASREQGVCDWRVVPYEPQEEPVVSDAPRMLPAKTVTRGWFDAIRRDGGGE